MWRGILLALAVCILACTPNHAADAEKQKTEANKAGASAIQPPEYYEPCRGDQKDRKSDLCAQWKTADWAKYAFWPSLVGAVGLIIALGFNLLAWKQARDAECHTKGALKAAQDNAVAAQIAADATARAAATSELALRAAHAANVHAIPPGVDGVDCSPGNPTLRMEVSLCNAGPANAMVLEWIAEVVAAKGPPRTLTPHPQIIPDPLIKAGDTWKGPASLDHEVPIDAIKASGWGIYLIGSFKHSDGLGEITETRFGYVSRANRIVFRSMGNEWNHSKKLKDT